MRQYLFEYWRAWLLAAVVGIAIALIMPLVPGISWIKQFLAFEGLGVLMSVWIILLLLVCCISPLLMDLGRRLWNTVQMERPPLLYVDVIAITIISFGTTILSFMWAGIISSPPTSRAMSLFLLGVFSLFGLWGYTLYIRSQWPKKRVTLSTSVHEPVGEYSDEPITDDVQDLLGRKIFVDKLYEQIIQLPAPNSFVFSLHATWGEGKTSVLNLLNRRLNANPKVITMLFNPWYLATESAVIQSFYVSIERELQSRYVLVGLRKTLSRYRNLLSSGLRSLGFGLELPIHDDPERLRQDLESWVERTGCRLVILIDDIDRLQPAEILSVFKMAALSARLKNIVFLLSFDHIMIRRLLADTAKVDPAFLEKVIQKPLQLPPAEQGDIDRFLLFSDPEGTEANRSAFDHLFDELKIPLNRRQEFDKKIVYFYRKHLKRVFRTIRQAKRYLNNLRATLPPVVDEVDLYDFVLLEILQVFFPEIYQDIWQNPRFYVPASTSEDMLSSPFLPFDAGDKYRQIREHIEALLSDEPHADIAKALLEELFSIEVKNAFSRTGHSNHDSIMQTYRLEKRLTHSECFPKYFLSRSPAGKIDDRAVEDLIHQWNEASDVEAQSLIIGTLQRFREAGQAGELLAMLHTFSGLVSPSCVPAMTRAVCRSAPDFSRARTDFWDSEFYRAERLVLQLLDERANSEAIQPLLEEIVRDAPLLPFVVLVVESCHHEGGGHHAQIYKHVDIQTLRTRAAERLHSYYVQGNHDIFAELSEEDWGFVLYRWGTDWMTSGSEARAIAQEYVFRLIEGNPQYLGQLLRYFADRNFGQQEGGFPYSAFCKVYEPEAVLERLNRYGDVALTTPGERRAAELFRQQFLNSLKLNTHADRQSAHLEQKSDNAPSSH
jgi:hypothetical protein